MNWLPARGLDELRRLAYNRGLWEDMGNGYLTKKPMKKQASVQVVAESEPNDSGEVRLRVTPQNAGPRPLIYYAENGPASENSPQLLDQLLTTSALRVSFFVRDPSGQYESGVPVVWENELIIRNSLDNSIDPRQLELLVAPKGTLLYTLDGSEPRGGKLYTGPFDLDDDEVRVLVFAEADGLEARADFSFPAKGGEGPRIDPVKPARLVSRSGGHRLDSRAKTFLGLQMAATLGVRFEKLNLTMGQGSKMARLSVGEVAMEAAFVTELLTKLLEKFDVEAPVDLSFQKAYFSSGHDLQSFADKMGLPLKPEDIEQS